MRRGVFQVVLGKIGEHPYRKLRFRTTNPRFGRPKLSVEVFARTDIENKEVLIDQYKDLNSTSLSYYEKMTRKRLNVVRSLSKDSLEIEEAEAACYMINSIFDIMAALTGYEWYYNA